MSLTERVNIIYNTPGNTLTKKNIRKTLSLYAEVLQDELMDTGSITISGFISLRLRKYAPRTCYNFKTKQSMKTEAYYKPVLSTSASLTKRLKSLL